MGAPLHVIRFTHQIFNDQHLSAGIEVTYDSLGLEAHDVGQFLQAINPTLDFAHVQGQVFYTLPNATDDWKKGCALDCLAFELNKVPSSFIPLAQEAIDFPLRKTTLAPIVAVFEGESLAHLYVAHCGSGYVEVGKQPLNRRMRKHKCLSSECAKKQTAPSNLKIVGSLFDLPYVYASALIFYRYIQGQGTAQYDCFVGVTR